MLSFSGLITGLIVYGLSWIAWSQLRDNPYATVESSQEGVPQDFVQVDQGIPREIPLPNFWNAPSAYGIQRLAILCADIQDSMQHQVLNYIVEKGDLIFKISKQFDINPETILWANSETLNDNPELLTIGMKLKFQQPTEFTISGKQEIQLQRWQPDSRQNPHQFFYGRKTI